MKTDKPTHIAPESDLLQDDLLHRAVTRRVPSGQLPSNFVYTTMLRVQEEAKRLERQRDRRWLIALITTSLLMLAGGFGTLWWTGGLDWFISSLHNSTESLSRPLFSEPATSVSEWYNIILLVVTAALLLIVDQLWLRHLIGRKTRRHKVNAPSAGRDSQ